MKSEKQVGCVLVRRFFGLLDCYLVDEEVILPC